MTIRRATIADIPTLMDLLQQILYVHHVASTLPLSSS